MSLPRFYLPSAQPPQPGMSLDLDPEQSRHALALRLRAGDALEVLLMDGPWRAELVAVNRKGARVRLVGSLEEWRESPLPIRACLPLTAQLSLWDEMLPPAVELGATEIQPVAFTRSEHDSRRTQARMDRWQRIIQTAAEQSHRSRVPKLLETIPFSGLSEEQAPQRWVAYELPTGESNPALTREALAFTHGPEGGITDEEAKSLQRWGWSFLSLGGSILRAVSCPGAILGAVQFQLGRKG